jgi:hypothetical protein
MFCAQAMERGEVLAVETAQDIQPMAYTVLTWQPYGRADAAADGRRQMPQQAIDAPDYVESDILSGTKPSRSTMLRARGARAHGRAVIMWRWCIAGGMLVALSSPTAAAHCSHGQIYRVHLRQCVSINSTLARGYVRRERPRYAYLLRPHRHHAEGDDRYYIEVTIRARPDEPAGQRAPEAQGMTPRPPEVEVTIPYAIKGSRMSEPPRFTGWQ